jgi:3-dehydroquinate synthase
LPALIDLKPELLADVVARCCEVKAAVVEQDETESGLRQILNFGHTIGHAIEAVSGYGKYLHGEAIAIGQVAAARLSGALLNAPALDVERVRDLFVRAGLPTGIHLKQTHMKRLIAAMRLDKKVSGGEIRFVLMERIGSVKWGEKVPLELVEEVLSG